MTGLQDRGWGTSREACAANDADFPAGDCWRGGSLLGDPAASARTELVVEIPTSHGTLTVGVLGRDERDVRTRLAAEVDGTLTDLQHDSAEDVPRDVIHEAMATEAKAAFRAGKARVAPGRASGQPEITP